jgi:hypothetical protein
MATGHRDHQVVARHPRVHYLEKNVLHEVDVQIVQVRLAMYLKVAKSAIHAGFGLLHKNVINLEFVHESLNPIFQRMSLAKNSKRVFEQNC